MAAQVIQRCGRGHSGRLFTGLYAKDNLVKIMLGKWLESVVFLPALWLSWCYWLYKHPMRPWAGKDTGYFVSQSYRVGTVATVQL